MTNDTNVTWHDHSVTRAEREALNKNKGCVVWFTGLSACGKSTVSNIVDHKLHSRGLHSYVLDGDNVRMGLNAGPGMQRGRSQIRLRPLLCSAVSVRRFARTLAMRCGRSAARRWGSCCLERCGGPAAPRRSCPRWR